MNEQASDSEMRERQRRINAEAAAWHVRIAHGAVGQDNPAYRAWLAAAPEHHVAMQRAQRLWQAFGDHAAAPEMVKARRDALDHSGKAAARRWSVFNRWSWLSNVSGPIKPAATVAAIAITIVISIAIIGAPTALLLERYERAILAPAVETHRTAVAETRVVTLADNSRVSLDASTMLTVHYSAEARDVELKQGQAHFDVATDNTRPFRVSAGERTVVATGTAFNIELVGDTVLVTLLEGEVIVTDTKPAAQPSSRQSATQAMPDPAQAAPVKMKPGQLLVASVEATPQIVENTNLEKTNAWRSGKVFLEGDSLSAAVARMNRYSRIELTVTDHRLERLRISGVFDAGDTDAFIEAVEAYFPVDARRMSTSRIEFHPRQ